MFNVLLSYVLLDRFEQQSGSKEYNQLEWNQVCVQFNREHGLLNPFFYLLSKNKGTSSNLIYDDF